MKIESIKVLKDNYVWAIINNNDIYIVDVGEATPIINYIEKNNLNLCGILITHNHVDHIGELDELLKKYQNNNLKVFGSKEVAEIVNTVVQEDDSFNIFDKNVKVIKSAGHTAEHISYLLDNKYLFCGDALFMAGCGRVFTGDYAEQFRTLQKFKSLNDDVLIYAGHEYSMMNLRFAKTIFSENYLVDKTILEVTKKLENNIPSLPTSIFLEKKINPFILAKNVKEFKKLRDMRDAFK